MSIRKSLLWSYGSQAITFVVSFSTSVVVARLLSPREVGIYALAVAVSAVLAIFMAFSVHTYLVREERVDRALLRSVFTVNAVLSIVLAGALFGMAFVESGYLGQPDVGAVLLLTSMAPLIAIFEFIPTALSMREMRYSLISAVNVVRVVVTSAVTVTLALRGYGAISLAIGPLVAGAVCATIYTATRWRDTVFAPSFANFRPIIAFGVQMISISGVAQLATRGSDLILGRLIGLSALGLYSRASNIQALVFSNVYGAATNVIFSHMSRELHNRGTVHDTFTTSIRNIIAIMWPLLIGLAILARPVVVTLYGERWLGAALPLSLLMVSTFVTLGFGMNWELFVLRKETARQTRFEMLRAIVGTSLFTVGCFFGIAWAAASRIVEAIVGYFLYRPHMDRLAGTRPGELERIYAEGLLLTGAATIPALLLMLWYRWSPATPMLLIAGAIALGVANWTGLLVARRHPLILEISRLYTRR
ncbi:Membrane protein involved in the export of O-antigen and teichoic acid [Sphingomonas palmae]|uniref:Membrane protein involved in the export of O-antigen and teichoic acid n=1 Tax=Sphingomonas palmae TaxID=1855283 RepID=A0A1H7UZ48_9SPHN|nr:oligosaccharide flippase family protein [Sphingomonas palmae]SEM02210.1 Membrane protein involved in the export of O-antigen and teichoic acid [Sphingomonas palmae]